MLNKFTHAKTVKICFLNVFSFLFLDSFITVHIERQSSLPITLSLLPSPAEIHILPNILLFSSLSVGV